MATDARAALVAMIVCACGRDVVVGYDLSRDAASTDARAPPSSIARAVVKEPNGFLVGGVTNADAWVAHLDGTGSLLRTSSFDMFGGDDRANGVFALASGYVVVGGATDSGRARAFVRGFDNNDKTSWTAMLDEPNGGSSEAFAIASGANGTLVIGGSETPSPPLDGWVARLDTAGNVLFRRALRDISQGQGGHARVYAITTNATDMIFAGGDRPFDTGSGTIDVPTVLRFDSVGNLTGSSTSMFGANVPGTIRGVHVIGSTVFMCADLGDHGGLASQTDYFAPILSNTLPAVTVTGCAPTSDGALIIVGTSHVNGDHAWATKVELSTLAPRWDRSLTAAPKLLAITPDGAGAFAAGGTSAPSPTWTVIAP